MKPIHSHANPCGSARFTALLLSLLLILSIIPHSDEQVTIVKSCRTLQDANAKRYRRAPQAIALARAAPIEIPLPPAVPAEPWHLLKESFLPYPIFYAATAVLNNSIVFLSGCLTADCASPVGQAHGAEPKLDPTALKLNGSTFSSNIERRDTSKVTTPSHPLTTADSPYHERSIALEVEKETVTPLTRLTLPAGLGFAGRHAAVTLTDSVYVPRSCTMTTLSPRDIAAMSAEAFQALRVAYAPVVAFYPEDKNPHAATPTPAVNLSYYEVPADRVRVNASCTALATENKILIIGGFLLSTLRVTASVDTFDVVTRKYESEVVFLSSPVLQPSVAASTGFAAIAGGWTYATSDGGDTSQKNITQPRVLPPSVPVIEYLFDLLFFEGEHMIGNGQLIWHKTRSGTSRERLRGASSICLSSVDASLVPFDVRQHILLAEQGCHIEVFGGQVVLVDHNLNHMAVFDVRASSASLALSSTPRARSTVRSLPVPLPRPPLHSFRGVVQNGVRRASLLSVNSETLSSLNVPTNDNEPDTTSRADSALSSSSASSSPSPPPTPSPTPTPPPAPVYHYRWEQPMLISLPLSHKTSIPQAKGNAQFWCPSLGGRIIAATLSTTTTAEPLTTPAPDVDPITDTILVFMALGGEDVWTQEVPEPVNEAVNIGIRKTDRITADSLLPIDPPSSSSSNAAPHPSREAVVQRFPARRLARRYVPDSAYDADRADLLAVKMPTPIWPAQLTLQTTSAGTIHLDFPDVNYTRYCLWESSRLHYEGRNEDGGQDEEGVTCAVRLSSRRDCVGNTAGTLDSVYNGAPNTSVLFSASGSTTPVYVCFGYAVHPTSWPMCHTQRSFSVLNPMMPLRILDNTPTLPPPTPTASPEPSEKTTSSPLFMFAVGISIVTLMVAVLLVARLQHVPEEGLLVEELFSRGYAHNVRGGGGNRGVQLASTTRGSYGHQRHYARVPGRDVDSDCGGGSGGDGSVANGEGSDGPLTRIDTFQQLVASVAGTNEARMLKSAADVLRLHQHRYRILSRVGQGDHSLCFLALRKPNRTPSSSSLALSERCPSTAGAANVGRRAASWFPMPPFPGHAAASASASSAHASTLSTSSLWAARYDHKAAVVVKYTQCPDDTTRAVITRMCERLRDLQAGGAVHSLASMSNSNGSPSSLHSRMSSGAAVGWPRDRQQRHPQSSNNYRRTQLLAEVASCAVSGTSSASVSPVGTEPQTSTRTLTQDPSAEPHQSVSAISFHHDVDGGNARSSQQSDFTPSVTNLTTENAQLESVKVNDEVDKDGVCAWLDAHEVDVVLSLFLLLPADLFVSYEVSVLQQQQQPPQLRPHQALLLHSHRGAASMGGRSGARLSSSLYRVTAQWNQQYIYVGQAGLRNHNNSTKFDVKEATTRTSKGLRARLRMKRTDSVKGEKDTLTEAQQNLSPAARAFIASLSDGAPRVCWEACVNALQPSTVSAWSLCLVMPYERAGDLADFMQRARQALPTGAWESPNVWGCDGGDQMTGCNNTTANGGSLANVIITVTKAKHCWTESLLCSLLFQISAGLQLLHQQTPPILQGDVKATNVLLREPTVFSVAHRRVHNTVFKTTSTSEVQITDVGIDPLLLPSVDSHHQRHPSRMFQSDTTPTLSFSPPSFLRKTTGLSSSPAFSPPWRAGNFVAAAAASAGGGSSQLSPTIAPVDAAPQPSMGASAAATNGQRSPRSSTPLLPPPAEWYLSTKSYLPVSLTDSGMSWWLAVQLQQRLRGCFGFTTRSTLRQSPAGRCWLSRYQSIPRGTDSLVEAAPSDASVAGLAHFLFDFIGVPTHIAPELIWGQLCHLSSAVSIEAASTAMEGSGNNGVGVCRDSGVFKWRQRVRQSATGKTHSGGVPRYAAQTSDAIVSVVRTDGGVDGLTSVTGRESAVSGCKHNSTDTNIRQTESEDASEDVDDALFVSNVSTDDLEAEGGTEEQASYEDGEDDREDMEGEEEGVFSPEEVSLLTSTMWKAEGLTRVSRQRPREGLGGNSISATNAAAVRGAGLTSSLSDTAAPMSATSLSSAFPGPSLTSPLLFPPSTQTLPPSLPPHNSYRALKSRHAFASVLGSGNGGGGSQSRSSVYEVLIQRVLAMDTASDVWSLGLLLYGMCTDALIAETEKAGGPPASMGTQQGQHQQKGETTAADTVTPMTCASKLAQRAFAALLSDLFALSYGSSQAPEVQPKKTSTTSETTESQVYDKDDAACGEDRLWWPRSCALEDEVEGAFLHAGYSRTFAQLMAHMLSPVAARRPSAAEIVDQVRLVVPAAASSSTSGASPNTKNSNPVMPTLAEVPHSVSQSGAAREEDSRKAAAAVVLNERTTLMKLRKRNWCS